MTTDASLVLLAARFRSARYCLQYCVDEYPHMTDVAARVQQALEAAARELRSAMARCGEVECYAVLGVIATESLVLELEEVLQC